MRPRGRGRALTTVVLLAVAAAVLIPGSSAGTTSKPYTATFGGGPLTAGTSQWIHLQVHNSASPQSIGSANITAAANAATPPVAFPITAVSTTDPSSSVTPLSPPSSFDSGLIRLRSLAIAPGSNFDLWIQTNVPCATGNYTWKIQAKQSNDFSGPPGNDFSLDAVRSNLVTAVGGSGCKFSAVFAPSTVTGGASTAINLTITNEAGGQALGSANVTPPAGFTITGAPSPMPGGSSWTGSGVQLRNLALAGGASYSVSIPVATACTPGSPSWAVAARTGVDYTGADFVLDAPNSSVSATVSGTNCKYVFLQQPKDAGVNATITGSSFNPSGSAVRVGVLNPATNALDASASANVSLTPSKNVASFSGTGPVALSGGQAQFGSLKSSSAGQFITLTASGSPFVTSDPSSAFDIVADLVACGTTCQASATQGDTSVDASVSGFTAGDVLAVSLFTAADFTPPPNCGGAGPFTPLPGASGANVEYVPTGNGWTLTVTLRIDKSLLPVSKGAAQFDVCLGAKRVTQASCATAPGSGFKTKSGALAACDYDGNPLSSPPTGLYWGVLPDCPNGNKPITDPCVKSKTKNNAGDLLLTVAMPAPWDATVHGG